MTHFVGETKQASARARTRCGFFERAGNLRLATLSSESMGYERVWAALAKPLATRGIVLFALLLNLPSLAIGLQGDDYDIARQVREQPWGAFAFTPADARVAREQALLRKQLGLAPWWQDDAYRQRFLRPLASLSHWFDTQILAAPAWWMHLENALWYALLVSAVGFAYRSVGLATPCAALACLFYACNAGPASSVGWISGRNSVLSALFGLLSLGCFARAEARRDVCAGLASLLAYAAGLACGEGGVAACAWLAAYALVRSERPRLQRLLSLLPFVVLTLLWRVYYVRHGYGAVASGFHRDPAHDPLGFARQFSLLLPIYLASQLTAPFANLAGLFPGSLLPTLGLALLVFAVLGRPVWQLLLTEPLARFFALGAAGSVVPLAATVAQDRLAFFVAFGALGLVAQLLAASTPDERKARFGPGMLWRQHALWAPPLYVAMSFGCKSSLLGGSATALAAAAPLADASVVVINGPSALSPHFVALMRARSGQPCPRFRMLYAGGDAVTVKRSGARSLELHPTQGWLASAIGSLGRDLERAPFAAGQRIVLPDVQIEVLEVNARAAPSRVSFQFAHSLDAGGSRLLAWREGQYATWRAPPLGESETLPSALPF
jgi:hypothetical protein